MNRIRCGMKSSHLVFIVMKTFVLNTMTPKWIFETILFVFFLDHRNPRYENQKKMWKNDKWINSKKIRSQNTKTVWMIRNEGKEIEHIFSIEFGAPSPAIITFIVYSFIKLEKWENIIDGHLECRYWKSVDSMKNWSNILNHSSHGYEQLSQTNKQLEFLNGISTASKLPSVGSII